MSHPAPDPRLVWVDLETTGLDPQRHGIVEIAMVITTAGLAIELAHASYEALVGCGEEWSSDALAMHTASGLMGVGPSRVHVEVAEQNCLDLLDAHGFAPGTALLAGSSVHFDRGFLAAHMPRLAARLHYRHFDVPMIREAIRRWIDPDFERDREPPKHRAMADVMASIELARRCQAIMRAGAEDA